MSVFGLGLPSWLASNQYLMIVALTAAAVTLLILHKETHAHIAMNLDLEMVEHLLGTSLTMFQ